MYQERQIRGQEEEGGWGRRYPSVGVYWMFQRALDQVRIACFIFTRLDHRQRTSGPVPIISLALPTLHAISIAGTCYDTCTRGDISCFTLPTPQEAFRSEPQFVCLTK